MTGINSIMSTAGAGMAAAIQQVAAVSQVIAEPGGIDSLADSSVELELSRQSFIADAIVFKMAGNMLGTLIDVVDSNRPA
jgi:hypothetical protein